MPRRIQLQNHQDESKTLYIEHPFSLDKCMCIDSEDDDCIFYSVGYDLKDLCKSLALTSLSTLLARAVCAWKSSMKMVQTQSLDTRDQ